MPRVSILKPLAGADDELEENLASFATLDYPDYEILFGVASMDDPANAVVQRFLRRPGYRRARLLLTDPDEAMNPKVAQLLALERAATGEVVVVSDSNVRVTPSYLDPLVAELARPGVAAVSSVIAGTGEQTLGAALENLQLGALVAPGVVSSAHLTGRAITIGKSMAMWREPLHDIGGFSRVAHLLSEDHMLGSLFVGFALASAGVSVGAATTSSWLAILPSFRPSRTCGAAFVHWCAHDPLSPPSLLPGYRQRWRPSHSSPTFTYSRIITRIGHSGLAPVFLC
jgi:ceramide glucosyltransferase